MKKCESANKNKLRRKEISLFGGFGSAVTLAVVFCGLTAVASVFLVSDTHATDASVINMSVASDTMNVDLLPNRANGTFAKSDDNTITVSTTSAKGYTLSIAASDEDGTYDRLVNENGDTCDNTGTNTNSSTGSKSSNCLTSISAATTEATFSALNGTGYNGLWGYLPSKYNSASNTDFLPAPTTSGNILDVTNVANSTVNTYSLAIGARVDMGTKMGKYSNHYAILVVANAIPYTITYEDTSISDMPADVDTTSFTETVNVSSLTPKKDGYTFLGWCSTAPTTSNFADTCSGTTYTVGQSYQIDKDSSTNDLHLYAMWQRHTMQNVASWKDSLAVGGETSAIDTRDGKTYTVAKLCTAYTGDTCTENQIWMTQNLDLLVGGAGVGNLTSADSDINQDLGTTMGYSTASGTITWTPGTTLNKQPAMINDHVYTGSASTNLTGWTNSNTAPYQAEGGDYYVYTSGNSSADTIYASLTACLNGGHTVEQCNHYHVGNYYNWSVAVAGNDTTSYTTDLYVMPNSICPKNWRLPNGLTGTTGNENISEFNKLALANGITNGQTTAHSGDDDRWVNVGWATNGFNNFRTSFTNSHGQQAPMYFVRSGYLSSTTLYGYGTGGYLWSSTVRSGSWGYYLGFYSGVLRPADQDARDYGFPVRCVAR